MDIFSKKKTRLAIVILNYNTYEITIKLVDQLVELIDDKQVLIIVVDNASTNDSVEQLTKASKEYGFKFIENKENGGYAKGNNIGIIYSQKCGAEYVLVMNNDIEIRNNELFDNMLCFMDKNKTVGALSPRIVGADGKNDPPIYFKKPTFWDLTFGIFKYKKERYKVDEFVMRKVYAPRGSFMLLRNESLIRINNLDENTFLYYEEPILAERLLTIGQECWHYGNDYVIHNHAVTIKKNVNKKRMVEIICNSYRYYLSNYRHFNKFWIWICLFIRKLTVRLR